MTNANDSLSQSDSLMPSWSVGDTIAVSFGSINSAYETEFALQNPSFFQIASSLDASPLDVILIQDANTSIPSIPRMDSDVDCACE